MRGYKKCLFNGVTVYGSAWRKNVGKLPTLNKIIIDNFCIALCSDVHKLTALYNTLQHFLSGNKIIKGNNVHESNTYIRTKNAYNYIHKKYIVHVLYEKRQNEIQRKKESDPPKQQQQLQQ